MTLIFDGDYPLAYGAFDLNRDPTLSLAELRAQDDSGAEAFACFPEMRRGGMRVMERGRDSDRRRRKFRLFT